MYWPAMYSVFALVAGLFGFGGVAGPTAWMAEILCVVLALLALVTAVDHLVTRYRARPPKLRVGGPPHAPRDPAAPARPDGVR